MFRGEPGTPGPGSCSWERHQGETKTSMPSGRKRLTRSAWLSTRAAALLLLDPGKQRARRRDDGVGDATPPSGALDADPIGRLAERLDLRSQRGCQRNGRVQIKTPGPTLTFDSRPVATLTSAMATNCTSGCASMKLRT